MMEQITDFTIQSVQIKEDVYHKVTAIRLRRLFIVLMPVYTRIASILPYCMKMVHDKLALHQCRNMIHQRRMRN